jgi:hypothetical protein
MKSGARTIKHIFRFVRYLSTFFHTYLPINIHFQLIIITIVSESNKTRLLRRPSCFSDNLVLQVTWFSENNSDKQVHLFGLLTFYWYFQWIFRKRNEQKNIYLFRLFIEKYMPRKSKLSFPSKTAKTSSVKRRQTEHVYLRFRLYLDNHVTSERDYRRSNMADEVGGICHKWDMCYDDELELNIYR